MLCGIYIILILLYAFLVYFKYTLKKALVTKIYILRIVCVLYYFLVLQKLNGTIIRFMAFCYFL